MRYIFIFTSILSIIKCDPRQSVTVGVVEYYPIQNSSLSAIQRLNGNAANYVTILESVKDKNLSLIVYPEMTLNIGNLIKDIFDTAVEIKSKNPCQSKDDYPEYIVTLSCAAKRFKTYLVINTVEKSLCNKNDESAKKSENCKKFNYYFFNSDIVFDRQGEIIATYHKYHLFGEYELDANPTPDFVTFKTDFNETFGIFTCFDVLFRNPAQGLVEKNLKSFVFPTMWFSEIPFLTAVQTQRMWSESHDVNLFASGANNPKEGSGGTGIYLGRQGSVVSDIIAKGGTKVYTYEWNSEIKVQKENKSIEELSEEMDNFILTRDNSLDQFTSSLLNLSSDAVQNTRLCHKSNFCCNFTTKVSLNETRDESKDSYVYHLVAFQGVRSFKQIYNAGIEVCAVVACLNSSISSCGRRFPNFKNVSWPVVFEEITIRATFEDTENRTQYPNSLLSSIRPIESNKTEWIIHKSKVGESITRIFSLKQEENRLLTFAIYGRNFDLDSPPNPNSAPLIKYDIPLILTVIIICFDIKRRLHEVS